MSGKAIYGMYESGGAKPQAPWEHLTNEERARWDYLARQVNDWYDED